MILKSSRPYGYFLNTIKWKILTITLLTLLVGYLDDILYKIYDFDLAIPAFFGTAIVLALTFRTNKAYNRWWEAKMIWETIVTSSRTWVRLVRHAIRETGEGGDAVDPEKERLIFRQLCWNYVLVARLRDQKPLQGMSKFISNDDLEYLSQIDNANQGLLFLQSRDLMKVLGENRIGLYEHIELEEIIRELEAAMGKAERIKKTHFPVLYDILFEIAIYIFCALLTYAIRDSLTIFEAAFSIVISTFFVMINEIAREMQDPFEDLPTDTPMLALSHEVESMTLQILGYEARPEPIHLGKFYIK